VTRREFITLLVGATAAWPLAARTQQPGKVYRFGFLANDPTIPTMAAGQAFRDGLHENGFIEGQNVSIEWRFMQGSVGRAAAFAAELVRLNVDVIVSSGVQSHPAVKRATAKIPIVMANSQDPVGEGLVASLAHPGGNITGLVQVVSAEFGGKRLQLFKDAVPQISRVGVIINPELKTDAPWSQRFGLYVGERTNFRNRTTFIASGRSYLCHSKRCAALIASAITRSEFMRHEMHAELWRATRHSAYPKNNLIRLVQNNRKDISKPLTKAS